MFRLWDNILIVGIFVFAIVMAIRTVCENTAQEKKPEIEPKDESDSTSHEDEDSVS